MNEEAVQYAFDLFVKDGYGDSIEDFKNLLKTNPEALSHSYNLFVKDGYGDNIDDFKTLIGVGQQQPTQQPPVKKKEDMESSWLLGDGISESEPSETEPYNPNKFIEGLTGQEPVVYKKAEVPFRDIEGGYADVQNRLSTIDKQIAESNPVMASVLKMEKSALLEKKKAIESSPVKEDGRPVDITAPKFIEDNLNALTPKQLAQYGPKGAKDVLDYYFKDAGFKFETDMYNIKAISPNGEILSFSTLYPSQKNVDDLRTFVRKSAYDNPDIAKKEYLYENENKKFKTKEEIDNEVKSINAKAEQFMGDSKKMLNLKKDIQDIEADLKRYKDFGEQNTPKYIQTEAYLKEKIDEYNNNLTGLESRQADLINQETQLNKAIGRYTEFQATQGDFGGGLYRSITNTIAGNFTQALRFATSKSIDVLPATTFMSTEEYNKEISKKLKEKGYEGDVVPLSVMDEVRREVKNDIKVAIRTGEYQGEKLDGVLTLDGIRESLSAFMNQPVSTTGEFLEKRQKDAGFVERGMYGLAGSLPAMIGGTYIRTMNMFLMTTDAALKEMDNNPNFAGISENEKELVALPIGVIGAALEEYGFRNLVKGTSITSNIVRTVIGRLPANASAATIRKTTLDVAKEMGLRGALALTGATLSETETGAAQQISEYAIKDIYESKWFKNRDMFDNPEFLSGQYLYDVFDAARTEAVGGFVMGVPYSVGAAMKQDGFRGLDDATFKIFEDLAKDNDSRKFFVISLKNKINSGEVTPNQGKQMLEAYDNAAGMIGTVPDEIVDTESRKVAMDLLSERKRLEAKKEGKDDALAKPIQDKINQINEQLTKLTEDAIQKQTTSQVSLQPETGAGQEMEVGGPEAKPQITPEESKRKEDLIAALGATDKDVVVIGDEMLDRKEAQSELDAITAKEQAVVAEQGGMEQGESVQASEETRKQALRDIMQATEDEVFILGTEDGTFAGDGLLNMNENGDVILTRFTDEEANLTKGKGVTENLASISGQFGGEQIATSGIEGGLQSFSNGVTGEYHIPLQDLIQLIKDGYIVFAGLGNKEFVLSPHIADKYLTKINGKNIIKEQATTEQKAETEQQTFDKRKAEIENITDPEQKKVAEIEFIMSNLMAGVGEASANKIREYADRIISGKETREQVIQGLPKSFVDGIDQLLAAQQPATEVTPERTAEQEADLLEELISGKKKEPVVTETVIEEKAPVEPTQFTEQDKARKAELEDAMKKADKRRKNIQVGETTMTKAEAKAELDALTQKEQAVPTEVAPTEVAPTTETKAAENPALANVEATTKALEVVDKETENLSTALDVAEGSLKETDLIKSEQRNKLIPIIKELLKDDKYIGQSFGGQTSEGKSKSISKGISEAYHKAKADGSNPELVQAVEEVLAPKPKETKGKNKTLADAVRKNLKIKGPGGLQSNILGILPAIWNAGVETMATAIEAGVAVTEAVQKAIEYIKENHGKKFNESAVEKKLLIGHYKGAIEIAREAKVTNEGLKTYFKRQGLTDAQIEPLLKVKEKAEKKPISKEKIIGKPKPKKVTVNEMTALKDQLRLEAKAAREAKGDLNAKRKMLTAAIKEMESKGSITVRQAKALINRVNAVNLDNPVMVERLLTYAENIFNDADYDLRMQDIRKLQNQVKRVNHVSMKDTVKEFISINPERIPADRLLDYIQALDDMNTRAPFYEKMNEMFDEVMSYKTESKEFDAIKTFQALIDKLESIAINKVKSVEDYVALIRDINSFKRKAYQLLQNGAITQEQYDQAIENIGKDQEAVEKKYEKELTELKKGLVQEIQALRPEPHPDFTAEEKALIDKYLELSESDLESLSPEDLYILNDLLNNIKEDAQLDYYRLSDIVSKAYTSAGAKQLTEQIKESKYDKSSDEGKKRLAEQESAFWEGLLGLGRATSGALQKFIVSPFNKAIASYEKYMKDSYFEFGKMKKKYNMKDINMHRIGMFTTYLQEYMAQFDPDNKNVDNIGKRDWFGQIISNNKMRDGYKSAKPSISRLFGRGDTELKMIERIHKSLPKDADGNVDPKAVYDSFMANDGKFFTRKEKAFFDEVMAWKEKNLTTKQKAANEMNGKGFKEIPFHMPRVRLDIGTKQISPTADVSSSGAVRIEAGVGKERKSQQVGPIMTNFEELFIDNLEQTGRNYYLQEAINDINNTLSATRKDLKGEKVELLNTISGTISEALNFEFERAESNLIISTNLLAARAAETLFSPIRTAVELTSTFLSYPFRAKTPQGYRELFGKQGQMKQLLEFTSSPMRLRENINKAIDISDGRIKPKNKFEKAVDYLSGLPERTMMVTSWMPIFNNEFKDITNEKFDIDKFNSSPEYRQKYGKAIKEAAAVADAQTEKIIGSVTKAGGRRQIRIAPKILANIIGYEGTVKKNSMAGQILGFFSNYPYREVNEFLNGFKEAAEVYRKGGGTLKTMSQLQKPLGISINVATYGFLSSAVYALKLFLLGDDDDEKKGEALLKELITVKGFMEELAGNSVALAAGKYAAGGRFILQTAATIAYNSTSDKEMQGKIKKMLKNSVFVEPLASEKVQTFGGRQEVVNAIASYVPQLVILAKRIEEGYDLAANLKFIYNKFGEKGLDALTEDEKSQVLLADSFLKGGQMIANIFGTSVPMYNDLMIYMRGLKKETGVDKIKLADAELSEKKKALHNYKNEEEFKKNDPTGYLEAIDEGGSLYEYKKAQSEKQEEKNKDKPFRGMSEEAFKKKYKQEWKEKYGPGTKYYYEQRTPEAIEKRRQMRKVEAQAKRIKKQNERNKER